MYFGHMSSSLSFEIIVIHDISTYGGGGGGEWGGVGAGRAAVNTGNALSSILSYISKKMHSISSRSKFFVFLIGKSDLQKTMRLPRLLFLSFILKPLTVKLLLLKESSSLVSLDHDITEVFHQR